MCIVPLLPFVTVHHIRVCFDVLFRMKVCVSLCCSPSFVCALGGDIAIPSHRHPAVRLWGTVPPLWGTVPPLWGTVTPPAALLRYRLTRFLVSRRKAATGEIEIEAEGGRRTLRSTCDWSEAAVNGEHLWMPTSASGDFCYVPDPDCSVGTRNRRDRYTCWRRSAPADTVPVGAEPALRGRSVW